MEIDKFITVEGIEGVGKSSHIDRLIRLIERSGQKAIKTREPGGTPTAERIRDAVLGHADEPIPAFAELLLMFASRSLLVENVIRPALDAGTWVVSDRFVDASRAYQGGGRGVSMERIDRLAEWVLGDLRPDLTILLDAPVDVGMARTGRRGEPDRLDVERADFYKRVRATYLDLATAEPDRFVLVDASADLATVGAEVEAAARALISDTD